MSDGDFVDEGPADVGFEGTDGVEVRQRDHDVGLPRPFPQPDIQRVLLIVRITLVQQDSFDEVTDVQCPIRIEAPVLEAISRLDHGRDYVERSPVGQHGVAVW